MILKADRNAWRVERADRAAVLIDAGPYFAAVRQALLNARSNVFIIGWDLDSRTRLVGPSGRADDGFPERLVEFLSALVARRRELTIRLLVWDHSVLYALEREPFPTLSLQWRTPRRIKFCLDDNLPLGASHHQKIIVVDDTVAFVGGLDLTIRRWDTSEHRLENRARVDPSGYGYRPFHDVQAMIDGAAARALGELARERWSAGACAPAPPLVVNAGADADPDADCWPRHLVPDFIGIDVAIARTLPAFEEQPPVREVEALFLDSIDTAEHSIYIENQFLTVSGIAHRLAERMRQRPELEVLIVAPKVHASWIEAQIMLSGRAAFMRVLAEAGLSERVRLLFPQVSEGDRTTDTMVHSKVMIVDDKLLRVGSANLNNRSMVLDTECDLAFEATTAVHRQSILNVRARLLADHCGVALDDVTAALARTGSLLATAQTLGDRGHSLQPAEDPDVVTIGSLREVADPERPIALPAFMQTFVGERPRARRIVRFARVITIGLIVLALVLIWRLTPLAELTRPETIHQWLTAVAEAPAAPLIIVAIFVVAGFLVFPVTLLIAATAAAFGPLLGFAYAAAGALASAVAGYAVGSAIGRRALEDAVGPRLNRIRRGIGRRGVLAVALVRMVPIAPFTLVNLAAGASRIPVTDFVLGTMLGLAPGIIVMSALGHQILQLIVQPTAANVMLFVLAVIVWIGLSVGVQAAVIRSRRLDA